MIIGIDVDEVLCRTNDYFLFEFNKKHGTNFKREELTRYDYECFEGYNGEYIFDCLVNHLHENLTFYDIFDDSKKVLKQLKEEGHQLYVITSRWKEFREKTIFWLNNHFGENFFDKILIYNDKYEKKCKAEVAKEYGVDILIDDAPKFALGAVKNGIYVLLMNHPWNQDIKNTKNLKRVYNWLEIKKEIDKITKSKNNSK